MKYNNDIEKYLYTKSGQKKIAEINSGKSFKFVEEETTEKYIHMLRLVGIKESYAYFHLSDMFGFELDGTKDGRLNQEEINRQREKIWYDCHNKEKPEEIEDIEWATLQWKEYDDVMKRDSEISRLIHRIYSVNVRDIK